MIEGHPGLCVFAEHRDVELDNTTLELLGKGRQLADKLNVELSAILLGYEVGSFADDLIRHGADKVYLADNHLLRNYATLPYVKVLTDLIKKERPEIVLFAANTTGRDLAPRLAARLETGLTADCTDLDIGDYEDKENDIRYENVLYQIVPAFGGNVMATIVNPERRPQMATVRPGTFEVSECDPKRPGEIIPFDVHLEENNNAIEVLEIKRDEEISHLNNAKIVVGCGRGVGGPEGIDLIKGLADALGAQVGASRAATDVGWMPYSHLVGLTGQTIKPDIYVACGISGAIQHTIGIKKSKKIIAINTDPKAPIFDIADYCVVGNMFEIIPELIKRIKIRA